MKEKEYYKLKADELRLSLKSFPDDLIKENKGRAFKLPSHNLIIGKEFFGSIEITAPDGSPWYVSDDLAEAKYLVYSRQSGRNEVIIPDSITMKAAVSDYETYLDLLMKEIVREFRSKFPEGDSPSAVAQIFRLLNLVRY